MKLIFMIFTAALFAAAAVRAEKIKISVKGSDTMAPLAQKWAEAYMQNNPDVTVEINAGGTGVGIASLLDGTADICDASRPMKPDEKADFVKKYDDEPVEYKVCLDAVAIYVNKENAIEKISFPQLEAIFTGKVLNWKEIGGPDAPISLYGRENSSGTYEFFKEHVLKAKDFAAATKTMPGTAAVIQAVMKDKNGIGYGGVAYAEGVKALKVSRTNGGEVVEPTEANVVSNAYPISRFLYNYVSPNKDRGAIATYIKWCISSEGQAIAKDAFYIPLHK